MLDFSQAATSLAIPSGQVRTTSSCSQTHSRTGGDREGHGETKQLLSGIPHSRAACTKRPVEVEGSADQGQVSEGLGEVAQRLAAGPDLLGVEPQVVGVA